MSVRTVKRNAPAYVWDDHEVVVRCGRRFVCLSAKAFSERFGQGPLQSIAEQWGLSILKHPEVT